MKTAPTAYCPDCDTARPLSVMTPDGLCSVCGDSVRDCDCDSCPDCGTELVP